ncbi:unnamed protein product, partial [Prorocentrum cordatum]
VDWTAPWFEPPAVDESMLPPILGHHVLHACKAFFPKTGLGESNIHPRLWAQGPAVGLAGLASILNCIECGSDWPVSQQCIIFWLQPKPKGGMRNLGLLPELVRVWEKIRADMCLYFDDLAASTRGDVAAVAALHMKLTDGIVFAFEQVLKLQVSRGRGGKTVVAVSRGRVERQLGSQNKQMGIQSKRIMKAKARSWKIQRVKAAGGAVERVVKLGIVPSELYGTRVQGATGTLITTLRRTVAAAFPGCNKGRSAALALLAEDADPAVIANAGPIAEWARAWQEATDMATLGLL